MNDQTSFPFWNNDWMKAQQDYWKAWSSLAENMPTLNQAPTKNPWIQAMDQWNQFLHPPQANGNDYLAQMLQQGKAFFQLSDQFNQFLQGLSNAGQASNDEWRSTLGQQFEQMKAVFAKHLEQTQSLSKMAGQWNLPFNGWNSGMGMGEPSQLWPFAPFMQNMKPDAWLGATGKLQDEMERYLSLPAVGITRESQEKGQEFLRLSADYQRALQEYMDAYRQLAITTLERLYQAIIAKADKGEKLSTLREVYNLWVDCGEAAYAEFAFSDEYSQIYARLVNSLMALKKNSRDQLDQTIGSLGMPTRKGFESMLTRQHEMHREISALKKQIASLTEQREETAPGAPALKAVPPSKPAEIQAAPEVPAEPPTEASPPPEAKVAAASAAKSPSGRRRSTTRASTAKHTTTKKAGE